MAESKHVESENTAYLRDTWLERKKYQSDWDRNIGVACA